MAMPRADEVHVQEVDFKCIPLQVDLMDHQPNGKLLSDQLIGYLQSLNLKNGRHSKRKLKQKYKLNLPYSVIKHDDQYFAIYKGKKQGKHLGSGAFGKVKSVQSQGGQGLVDSWDAIKVQEEPFDGTECHISASLDQLIVPQYSYTSSHKQKKKYCIILKFLPGMNLFDYLSQSCSHKKRIDPRILIQYVIDILKMINSIHQKGILHRDIKLGNLLIDRVYDELNLTDFGHARYADESLQYIGTAGYGTEKYVPKEYKLGENKYFANEKTEMFSIGVTVLELLGFIVFDKKLFHNTAFSNAHLETRELFDRLVSVANGTTDPNIFTWEQEDEFYTGYAKFPLIPFLIRMVSQDSDERPSVQEAIEFFTEFRKELVPTEEDVVVIDVDEYLGLPQEKKTEFRSKLHRYDKVVLMHETKAEDQIHRSDYFEVIKKFNRHGIPVYRTVVQGNNKRAMLQHIVQRFSPAGRNTNFYYFSSVCSANFTACEGTPVNFSFNSSVNRFRQQLGDVLRQFDISQMFIANPSFGLFNNPHNQLTQLIASDWSHAIGELNQLLLEPVLRMDVISSIIESTILSTYFAINNTPVVPANYILGPFYRLIFPILIQTVPEVASDILINVSRSISAAYPTDSIIPWETFFSGLNLDPPYVAMMMQCISRKYNTDNHPLANNITKTT